MWPLWDTEERGTRADIREEGEYALLSLSMLKRSQLVLRSSPFVFSWRNSEVPPETCFYTPSFKVYPGGQV